MKKIAVSIALVSFFLGSSTIAQKKKYIYRYILRL